MLRIVLSFGALAMLLGASAAFAFPPIDLTVAGSSYTSSDGTVWPKDRIEPGTHV